MRVEVRLINGRRPTIPSQRPAMADASEKLADAERALGEAEGQAWAAREAAALRAAMERARRLVTQIQETEAEIARLRQAAPAEDHGVKARALDTAMKRHAERFPAELAKLGAALVALERRQETVAAKSHAGA